MPFPFVPLIIAGAQVAASAIAARQQKKSNMELAKFQASANESYLDKQNAYNTPASQMQRYRDAGLNANLAYSQGTPGNQSSPLSYPEIGRVDYQQVGANLSNTFNQSQLMQSQVAATDAKTRQTYAMTELNKMQTKLIQSNPLLDDAGYKATIDGLKAAAELKATQNAGQVIQNQINGMSAGHQVNKIFKEVELLEQKFNLGTQDAAIKAEILKSKEFQNAILDVQKRFMTDGDITPQHIMQFIMLLLTKSFSK